MFAYGAMMTSVLLAGNTYIRTDHLWKELVVYNSHGVQEYGSQILHFNTKNRQPRIADQSGETARYMDENFKNCKVCSSDAEILKYAVEAGLKDFEQNGGAFLEFGVGVGKTTNFIAALVPHNFVHGFDSFKGLPEYWKSGLDKGA